MYATLFLMQISTMLFCAFDCLCVWLNSNDTFTAPKPRINVKIMNACIFGKWQKIVIDFVKAAVR